MEAIIIDTDPSSAIQCAIRNKVGRFVFRTPIDTSPIQLGIPVLVGCPVEKLAPGVRKVLTLLEEVDPPGNEG